MTLTLRYFFHKVNFKGIIQPLQADRGFAIEEVSFLSFFSTSRYVGFFWGGWIEKRGERSAGYGFTEMQFLRKPDLHGMTECRMAEWWDGGMAEWRSGGTEWRNGMAEQNGRREWRNGMAEWQNKMAGLQGTAEWRKG